MTRLVDIKGKWRLTNDPHGVWFGDEVSSSSCLIGRVSLIRGRGGSWAGGTCMP